VVWLVASEVRKSEDESGALYSTSVCLQSLVVVSQSHEKNVRPVTSDSFVTMHFAEWELFGLRKFRSQAKLGSRCWVKLVLAVDQLFWFPEASLTELRGMTDLLYTIDI